MSDPVDKPGPRDPSAEDGLGMGERRVGPERRVRSDRRTPAERFAAADKRSEADRRAGAERRAQTERRARAYRRAAGRRGFRGRVRRATMGRRLVFVAVAAIVVIAVVIAVIVTQAHNGGGGVPGVTPGGTHTTVSSPYDMTEAPATADLKIIKDARFVSIDLKAASGKLTSYMLDASLPAMQALETAVLKAKKVDEAVASGGSTITFVTAGRQTVTFDLDVDRGLVGRGGNTWRPSGDLKALVTAATSAHT